MTTYVYRYEHQDYPWLYVGKADSKLEDRINAHKKESKFEPYLENTTIYYIELSNKAQSKFIETYLIDKYKPLLNVADKYEEDSCFEMNIPEWKLYSDFKEVKTLTKETQKKPRTIQKKRPIEIIYNCIPREKYKTYYDARLHEYNVNYAIVENLLNDVNSFILDIGDYNDNHLYYNWIWMPEYDPNVKHILKELNHINGNSYKFIFNYDVNTDEFKEYLKYYIKQFKYDVDCLYEYINKQPA